MPVAVDSQPGEGQQSPSNDQQQPTKRKLFSLKSWSSKSRRLSVFGNDSGDPTGEEVNGSGSRPSSPVLPAALVAKPDHEGRVKFYHRGQDNFFLSNSSDFAVISDDIRYPTAEHLFQASKFLPHRPDLANKVRKAGNPLDAIKIARKFSEDVKPGWIREGINVQTMRNVLLLKFTQHSNLKEALLETGDANLVNDSPNDAFWGATSDRRGRNELGKALISVRETIRTSSGLGWGSAAKTV